MLVPPPCRSEQVNYYPSRLPAAHVNTGGFADVYKGAHHGKEVVLKRIRLLLPAVSESDLDRVCSVDHIHGIETHFTVTR
jgi:hypothetical protein